MKESLKAEMNELNPHFSHVTLSYIKLLCRLKNSCSGFILQKPEMNAVPMGHLTHMQSLSDFCTNYVYK